MKRFCHIGWGLLFVGSVLGQTAGFHFDNITGDNGLSDDIVTAILKARNGAMWISSASGLNYFDGANFMIFRNSADSNSLLSNSINSLCEDREGNIWGATDLGVFCYGIRQKQFSNYLLPGQTRMAWNILCDRQGDIWVTGWFGLFVYSQSQKRFREVLNTRSTGAAGIHTLRINSIVEDPSGKGFWLGGARGLYYFDKASRLVLTPKDINGNPVMQPHRIYPLATSHGKHIWLFDNNTKEIIGFDPEASRTISRISLAQILPDASGHYLHEASDGKLWFGTSDNRILAIDTRKNNRATPIQHELGNNRSIASNQLMHAYEDDDGTLWLATTGGISKWSGERSLYSVHKVLTQLSGIGPNDYIGALVEDPTDLSWWFVLAPNYNKLVHYHAEKGHIKTYNIQLLIPPGIQERPGHTFKLHFIEGKLILHTWKGVWQFDKQQAKLIPFRQLPAPFQNFNAIHVLTTDSINYYHINAREVIWYHKPANRVTKLRSLSPQTIAHLPGIHHPVTKPGQPLWVVSASGWLLAYDRDRWDSVRLWKNDEWESHGWFTWNDLDSTGKVWAGNYGGGLYAYNPRDRSVQRFTEANGLLFNQISCIAVDNNNNVWCSDRNRYSVYMQKTGQFFNFKLTGYQHFGSWYMHLGMLRNGHIVASSFRDVIEFFPDRLLQKPTIQTPVISSISVNNEEVFLGEDTFIHLQPDENELIIRFGTLTERRTFPYYLAYRLEGFEKATRKAEDESVAHYGNLLPGQYRFRLQCIAKDSSWVSPEKVLTILIDKPFYQTIWFFLMSLMIVSALLYSIYRIRLSQQSVMLTLGNRADTLEKEKALIQFESLKQQLNPHLLFNSLTSLRSLIRKDAKSATRFLDGMSKTYRYILKSGERELVTLREEVDFAETFAGLQQVRFGDGLQVTTHIAEADLDKLISPVALQNLVENAIKHNTTSTESPLCIDILTEDGYVVVRNNLQRYRLVESSNQSGLKSLKSLYAFYTDREVQVRDDGEFFEVRVPLL